MIRELYFISKLDFLISINASPFENSKDLERINFFRQVASENKFNLIYLNTVGGQDEIVFDLYGGVGLFTLPISKLIGKNGQVHLIEMNDTCIEDANNMLEHIDNIYIHHGTVEQKLGSVKNIDTIILDPPRNGVSKQVINQMIEKKPNTIIYVSCNPSTLARDSKILLENKYSLSNIVGLDLFPMTHHIESVASFKKYNF